MSTPNIKENGGEENRGENKEGIGRVEKEEERREKREKERDFEELIINGNIDSHNTFSDTYKDGGMLWGARHTLGLLVFLGMMFAYMVRVSLSIAIVAMTQAVPHTQNLTDVCPMPYEEDHITNSNMEGEYNWDEQTQGLILGSFFWGYTVTSFAGGRASEYLGGRLVLGLGLVIPSALALLSPVCVAVSKELFIALRVLQGLAQGVTFPAMHYIFASWIPPKDRGVYCPIVLSGATTGTVLAMSLGGWLCSSGFLGGWPSVFYVFGGLGVAWGVPWFLLVHDLPEHHPRIHPKELAYLTAHRNLVKRVKTEPLPVRDIATSVPFWSIVIMSFGYNYVSFNLLTELPTYFHTIQHFDLSSNGLMSAVPYIIQVITTVGWGAIVSALTNRHKASVIFIRKLSTAVGMYGSAFGFITMMWVGCNSRLAMGVMCIAVGAMGPVQSGSVLSEQDIAPNFAGSLKGFTNTIASATGILAPAITGAFINNNPTLGAWRLVFGTAGVLSIVCASQFLILGSDKVQPWNNPTRSTYRNAETTDAERNSVERNGQQTHTHREMEGEMT